MYHSIKEWCLEYLVIYKLYETGPVDRCKMRRKSDCSGLMAFQAQQRQKQQQQPQLLVISKKILKSLNFDI